MTAQFEVRMDDLTDRLRYSLRMVGLNGGEMALYLGVSRATVSEWLNGHAEPKLGMVRAWAERTGVPTRWLAEASPATKAAWELCAIRDLNPEPAD